MRKIYKSIILLLSIFIFVDVNAQILAFPTAEGYGKFAKGGRGGKVVFVENVPVPVAAEYLHRHDFQIVLDIEYPVEPAQKG